MRRRPEPAQMVAEMVARSGQSLSPALAKTIADALLSWADSAYEAREQLPQQAWVDERFREHVRADLRRRLFEEVAQQGRIPTGLPSEAIRYLAHPRFFPDADQPEVPAEMVEAGAPYEMVELILAVPCRTPAVDRAAAVRAGIL